LLLKVFFYVTIIDMDLLSMCKTVFSKGYSPAKLFLICS